MNSVAELLFELRGKGVKVWNEDGWLRYQSPTGAAAEDIERLRSRKPEIISFLESTSHSFEEAEPRLMRRSSADPIPLTFTQQSWWHLLGLDTKPSMRLACWAVRLSGRLNVKALRDSVAEFTRRHESLRTRIVRVNGILRQEIDESRTCQLVDAELTGSSKIEREQEAKDQVAKMVLEPIDVSVDPLFLAKLFTLDRDEHVLALTMDHLIEDAATLNILRREIFELYRQAISGEPFCLPQIPVQFADFAVWQQKSNRSWEQEHGDYWNQRLAGARRARAFADNPQTTTGSPTWGRVAIQLSESLCTELRELSRRERTTIVMTVLTAYIALMSRWCNETDVVVPFITAGRPGPEVEHSIGFFGAALFLRIELRKSDSLMDVLRRVIDEFVCANEHHDHGRMAAQPSRPEFILNPAFNWFPEEFDWTAEAFIHADKHGVSHSVRAQSFPVDFTLNVEWETAEFGLFFFEGPSGVRGGMGFRRNQVTSESAERFERTFRFFLENLARNPNIHLAEVPLVE